MADKVDEALRLDTLESSVAADQED